MHDVAGVDQPYADPAVQRRNDRGIAQLRPRGIDLRLILTDLRLLLRHRGLRGVGLLLGRVIGRHEFLIAREIEPRVGQGCLIQRLFRDRVVERGLVDPGIDARQHVAGVDVLAFFERDRDQRSVDHGLYRHRLERLHRA